MSGSKIGTWEGRPSVSVVVPTLNEADNIDALLAALVIQRPAGCEVEIVVVDDGSTDGTREHVRRWAKEHPVRLLPRDSERGLASAVLAGAGKAEGEILVVMDADLSHPPEAIGELVAPIAAGSHDMVVGSRYVPGGKTPGWPWRRRLISRVAAAMARPLTPLRDPLSGFFAIRRDGLRCIDPEAEGFKVGLEAIVLGGDSLRVTEVPIHFRDRRHGHSKFDVHQVAWYLRRLAALAGCAFNLSALPWLARLVAFGGVLDVALLWALRAGGAGLFVSQASSFVCAALGMLAVARAHAPGPVLLAGVPEAPSRLRLAARVAAVLGLSMVLREGVLALALDRWGWPAPLGAVAATTVTSVVLGAGLGFFAFGNARRGSVRWRLAALGVLGYALALRLVYLGLPNLLPEEAYYWLYAQHLDIGYLDHPPMVAWLIALGTSALGKTELAVRFPALLCGLVGAVFVARLARNLYGEVASWVALMLFAALPFAFAMGFLMTPDAPLLACWAAALYFLERALLGERPRAFVGAGIALGLGLLSKYTIALLVPAALCFVAFDERSRRWLLRPEPYAAALLAALIFSPVIVWKRATSGRRSCSRAPTASRRSRRSVSPSSWGRSSCC